MRIKLPLFFLMLILTLASVNAVFYPEPWGNNVDAGNNSLTNVYNISVNGYVIGSFVGDIDSVNWTKLQNYPVACPGSSAITQLDDSVTCSDLWFNIAGNETITGNMTFGGGGIFNLSFVESLNWTNVTITESQISNLVHTVNGTNINISSINSSDWSDVNITESQIYNLIHTVNGTNINVSGINASYIISLNWTDVNITESQISDLIHTVNGTNINVSEMNASSATIRGNVNMSEGNLTLMDKITFAYGEVIDNLVDGWITITGGLNVTEDLYVVGNATMNQIYGEMWFHNDTTGNITVLTEDAWANVSAFGQETNGQSLNGFTYASNVLTAQVAGLYKIDYHVTFYGTVNNKYHTAAAVNNAVQFQTESHDRIDSGTDILGIGGTGFLQLAIGDDVTLQMMNEDSSGDGTINAVNLNLGRIGD